MVVVWLVARIMGEETFRTCVQVYLEIYVLMFLLFISGYEFD